MPLHCRSRHLITGDVIAEAYLPPLLILPYIELMRHFRRYHADAGYAICIRCHYAGDITLLPC